MFVCMWFSLFVQFVVSCVAIIRRDCVCVCISLSLYIYIYIYVHNVYYAMYRVLRYDLGGPVEAAGRLGRVRHHREGRRRRPEARAAEPAGVRESTQ